MLLEFRLRNYRAFREEATLSMVASHDKVLIDANTHEIGLPGAARLVRAAAVYGPNAGGKTTLLRALQLMRGVVVESAGLKPDQAFNVQPFRLDAAAKNEPTLFEVTVLIDGVRHQYGFEFTPTRIIKEWLLVYQTARPQAWINRTFDPKTEKEVFNFSSHMAGSRHVWRDATRPNALFLSTAIQLNSESLQPLFKWFAVSLNVFLGGGIIPHDFSTGMLENEAGRSAIASILSAADIGIRDIALEKKKGIQAQFTINPTTGEALSTTTQHDVFFPKFRHTVGDVSEEFEYVDESEGTQKLFSLAGPMLDIIRSGSLLVVDELDRSMHPLLVRQIVKTFQDPAINTNGAQLLFSTHDTSLLDSSLLRRDQIWFAEKDASQASALSPLSDFSVRNDEAFERGYLSGRYGGVPILEGKLLPSRRHGSR